MAESRGMVIVGAGHTGGRAAHALRDAGWNGPITLIGAERYPPYERPPLSKGMLTGEKTFADAALYESDSWRRQGINHLAGTTVREIRRASREVILADGRVIPYERLLLATGAAPRRLVVPGADLSGVLFMREVGDSETLRARLGEGRRLVVIGGGFIGLEVASNAAALGTQVTVVEAGPRLMTRTVPARIEEHMRARHKAAGVDLRLARQVSAILGDGSVSAVRLDDGSEIAADAVLVSIGVAPRVELAEAAGLAVDNGIVVDRTLRTEDPHIFAAGDVCSFAHDLFGGRIRLESWKNAEEQGPIAARNMLGGSEAADAVPWMWSDQYELTIQIAGLSDRAATTVERRVEPGSIILFHLSDDGRIVAASGVGPNGTIGRAVRLGQMMVERSLYPDPRLLADPTVNLKTLMREQAA
ncbi:MAG TPA: FAD-dependent oxidoreductase [Bauldia sp.]|nr:FAD-dependent oxidoreductase [Bauldia sp.]